MNERKASLQRHICCSGLFFAHVVGGCRALIVLECCSCGRLWHQREDRQLVPYDRTLIPALLVAD